MGLKYIHPDMWRAFVAVSSVNHGETEESWRHEPRTTAVVHNTGCKDRGERCEPGR